MERTSQTHTQTRSRSHGCLLFSRNSRVPPTLPEIHSLRNALHVKSKPHISYRICFLNRTGYKINMRNLQLEVEKRSYRLSINYRRKEIPKILQTVTLNKSVLMEFYRCFHSNLSIVHSSFCALREQREPFTLKILRRINFHSCLCILYSPQSDFWRQKYFQKRKWHGAFEDACIWLTLTNK